MTRSFVRPFALVAALAWGTLAAGAAETYTKEHLAAARAAIEASHVSDGFDNVLIGVAQTAKSTFERNNPSYTPQIDETTNRIAIDLAAKRPELDRQVQQIWASKFTQAELQEIAKFYTSPVGQKLSRETSGIVSLTLPLVQAYKTALEQEMFKRIVDDLKKQGLPF